MHLVIIHLHQLSKVAHLAPIIIKLCLNFVRRMIRFFILFMYLRWYHVSSIVSDYLFSPRKKNFVKRVAIISRLHVVVEYLSKSISSVTKNVKQLPALLSEATAKLINTLTANNCSSTVPDVTMKLFCQLMLGKHSSSLYQITDILLSGLASFVQGTSNSFITFEFWKNWYSEIVVVWKLN